MKKLWTVARYPSGNWDTGGEPTAPEYAQCEVWQVMADSRERAKKIAQGKRSRAQAKLAAARKEGAQ